MAELTPCSGHDPNAGVFEAVFHRLLSHRADLEALSGVDARYPNNRIESCDGLPMNALTRKGLLRLLDTIERPLFRVDEARRTSPQ